MDVLITGASGTVGTAISDHLHDSDDYDFTYLDREPHPDHETVSTDITDYGAIREAIAGHDAVIHLALIPGLSAFERDVGWSEAMAGNLKGTTNVLEAAVATDTEKVIFASSNHAVGMYEVKNAPDIYYPDFDLMVDHTVVPRPDSMYGLVKVYGEGIGRLCAEAHGVSFYSLRIGAIRDPEYDHPYGDAERGVDDGDWDRDSEQYREQVARLKGMWQSRRDFAHMVDCCLAD
ncbi:MAG: NAD-dependent epimerase/dehydratase family protein, partial [Halobacteriales archaeon]